MDKKMLLAVDGSPKGFEAVSILGSLLKGQSDLKLLVFHCVQQLARIAPGELCMNVEETCRLPFSDQEKIGNFVLQEANRRLVEAGFPRDRIELELQLDSTDPALDILAEASKKGIRTIAVGRRGRGQLESLLLGSVSSKVAQYSKDRTVWIIDTPVHQSGKVLVAIEGAPDSRALTQYTAEYVSGITGLSYTFMHLMPPIPPTFWDDGHILGSAEQKDRQSRIDSWRSDWTGRVEKYMTEGRTELARQGIAEDKVDTFILQTKEGIARDLLNEIAEHQFQLVVMGKKSFHERKPFLLGSHANKVLQNAEGAILCLVDS